jgi:hypothetical protein
MKARVFFSFILIVSLVLVSSTSGSLAREPGLNPLANTQQAQFAELVGQIGGTIPAVALDEDYVYVGAGAGPTTVNLSHPLRLAAVGRTAALPGVVKGVMMTQSYAYIPTGGWGLHIVEASEPLTMTEQVFLPWVSRNYTPPPPPTGTLFKDYNGDGLLDPGEPGIEGLQVTAYDKDGNQIGSTTTDSEGKYWFNLGNEHGEEIDIIVENTTDEPEDQYWYWRESLGLVERPGRVVKDENDNIVASFPRMMLWDSQVYPIETSIPITVGEKNETGLQQGYLNSPIRVADINSFQENNTLGSTPLNRGQVHH